MKEPMILEQFVWEHPDDADHAIGNATFARVAARVPLCRVFSAGVASLHL